MISDASAAMKMHDSEANIDTELVGRLMAAQFPRLAGLPVTPFRSTGTVNAIYRLGDHLYARLPRVSRWARDLETESHWLPRLAPGLSLQVPEPVAMGRPGGGYPWSWAIYRWIDGQPYADELIADERQAARDLAGFVTGLRRADTARAARRAQAAARARRPRPARRSSRPATTSTGTRSQPPGTWPWRHPPGTAGRRPESTPTCYAPTCWWTAGGCARSSTGARPAPGIPPRT